MCQANTSFFAFSLPATKNCRHQQHLMSSHRTWPLSPLTTEAFLGRVWDEPSMDWVSTEERDALAYRTLVDLCTVIFGFFGCMWCRVRGRRVVDHIEGHHPGQKQFVISDYKHNKTRNKRRQRLQFLQQELAQRIWPLCRSCHLQEHNG